MAGETVELPKPVADLIAEVKRVQQKIATLKELNAPAGVIDQLSELLARAEREIAEAISEDAKRELAALGQAAAGVAAGNAPLAPPGEVKPNAEQNAIRELLDEAERIRQKLKVAQENGAKPNDLKPIENELAKLKDAIRDAALAAAKREVDQAKKEAKNLEQGKPAFPPPKPKPKKDDGDDDDSGGGGGGGGTGGNGGDDDDGGNVIGEIKEGNEIPDALRMYVRSENIVWAWSRFTQSWVEQKFNSKIIDVQLIDNAILVIAEHQAAIFDAGFGVWIALLDTGPATLLEGEAS